MESKIERKNPNWALLFRVNEEYAILHNPKAATPYNVAHYYNPETNEWGNGNYASSLESAMAIALQKMESSFIKSERQVTQETETGLSWDRLVELTTLMKDGLIEDEPYEAKEYFKDTCDMTEPEMAFFGIKESD